MVSYEGVGFIRGGMRELFGMLEMFYILINVRGIHLWKHLIILLRPVLYTYFNLIYKKINFDHFHLFIPGVLRSIKFRK